MLFSGFVILKIRVRCIESPVVLLFIASTSGLTSCLACCEGDPVAPIEDHLLVQSRTSHSRTRKAIRGGKVLKLEEGDDKEE